MSSHVFSQLLFSHLHFRRTLRIDQLNYVYSKLRYSKNCRSYIGHVSFIYGVVNEATSFSSVAISYRLIGLKIQFCLSFNWNTSDIVWSSQITIADFLSLCKWRQMTRFDICDWLSLFLKLTSLVFEFRFTFSEQRRRVFLLNQRFQNWMSVQKCMEWLTTDKILSVDEEIFCCIQEIHWWFWYSTLSINVFIGCFSVRINFNLHF